MTLIAGFKCHVPEVPDEPCFVVCADSQETIKDARTKHEYRVTRQKIKPKLCGNFELAIGGSGANGILIDACVHRLQKAVCKLKVQKLDELEDFLCSELRDFYKNEATAYAKKERAVNLLIVARSLRPPDVQMWQTKAAQLIPIESKTLVGWNEHIYELFAERLYPDDGAPLPIQQAILLGMYLMFLAECTSNYVRSPITVVVGRKYRIAVLSPKRVKSFADRMALFAIATDKLLLSCADHTLKREDYICNLDEFKSTVLQLRDDYVEEAMQDVADFMDPHNPVRNVPHGVLATRMASGKVRVTEDPDKVRAFKKQMEWIRIQANAGPIKIKLHCIKCSAVFEVEAPNYRAGFGREFPCENCGEINRVGAIHMDDVSLVVTPSAARKSEGQP